MTDTQAQIDEAISRIPAYGLPSVHTQEHLLDAALESDDIEVVKAHLQHVWDHYQALEFALASYDFNKGALLDGIEDHDLQEAWAADPAGVAVQAIGTNIILATYEAAHSAETFAQMLGINPTDMLRDVYAEALGGEDAFNDPTAADGVVDTEEGEDQ